MATSKELENFWVVIPAGGSGTRLWPMSRSTRPKFLLDLAGQGRSLLQATWDRLVPLCGDRFMVVTGVAHEKSVGQQLPLLCSDNLLVEPSPRDSMAAIGLAAATLEARDPDTIMGSFPADQVISDQDEFEECVRQGYGAAKAGLLCLIGIEPRRPTSALGYIRMGDNIGLPAAARARRIEAFVEKPSEDRASRFLHTGRYLWNAGMWIVRAGTLMDLLAERKPELARSLRMIARNPREMDRAWQSIEKITIDHALAEPLAGTTKVCIVPGRFDWEDIGDFGALNAFLSRAQSVPGMNRLGNADQIVHLDSTGLAVSNSGRVVAVLGLDNVVVVDTDDSLLVMSVEYAQRVKEIYQRAVDREPGVA